MIVVKRIARVCLVFVAAAFLWSAEAVPAPAQKPGPDGAPNPEASVVDEGTLLKQAPRVEGRIDIPDTKASVLIQPAGRTWDYFHEVLLRWVGAIVILGMIGALGAGYLIIGRLRISGGRSGHKVPRFNSFERFSHWLTATSFVILGLTGLNITFGKILLMPVIGHEAFSGLSQVAKYTHNFVSFSFVAGLVIIVLIFIKDNLPQKVDLDWLRQGGGFIASKHAPAGRFNLGEKLVFWFSLAAGIAVSISGYLLLFPFSFSEIAGMQIAQVVHAFVAILFVALILAHIYIGTLGMEGAFEAMGSGEVDLNWAKEHHDIWLAQQLAKQGRKPSPEQSTATPAE
jgi:formate dehydrogenase subunit gamma